MNIKDRQPKKNKTKQTEVKKQRLNNLLKIQKHCFEQFNNNECPDYPVIQRNNVLYITLSLQDLCRILKLRHKSGACQTIKRYVNDGQVSQIDLTNKVFKSEHTAKAYRVNYNNTDTINNLSSRNLYPNRNYNVSDALSYLKEQATKTNQKVNDSELFTRKTAKRMGYILREIFHNDLEKFKQFIMKLFAVAKSGTRRLLKSTKIHALLSFKRFSRIYNYYCKRYSSKQASELRYGYSLPGKPEAGKPEAPQSALDTILKRIKDKKDKKLTTNKVHKETSHLTAKYIEEYKKRFWPVYDNNS